MVVVCSFVFDTRKPTRRVKQNAQKDAQDCVCPMHLLVEVLEYLWGKIIGYNSPTLSRRTKYTMSPCPILKFSRFLQARFEHNALAYIDDFINDVMLSPPAALATSLWQAGVLPEQSAVRNSSLPDLTVAGA